MEDLTLTKCGNNVHTYLTTIQEKRNEINANLPDGEEYPARRFHTNMFTQLDKSTCDDLLTNVKDAKSRWIKSPNTFDQETEIGYLIKLYTNYASTGTWMMSNKKDVKIIAMVTSSTRISSRTRVQTTVPTALARSPGPIPGKCLARDPPWILGAFPSMAKLKQKMGSSRSGVPIMDTIMIKATRA